MKQEHPILSPVPEAGFQGLSAGSRAVETGDGRSLGGARSVTQARAGSLASVSFRVGLPLVWDRESRQQGGVTSLRAQRGNSGPGGPYRAFHGAVGSQGPGGRQAARELASRVVQEPAWPGSPGSPRVEKLCPPSPLTSEASSEARGRGSSWRAHPFVSHFRCPFGQPSAQGGGSHLRSNRDGPS